MAVEIGDSVEVGGGGDGFLDYRGVGCLGCHVE